MSTPRTREERVRYALRQAAAHVMTALHHGAVTDPTALAALARPSLEAMESLAAALGAHPRPTVQRDGVDREPVACDPATREPLPQDGEP